jgi:type II secretory pathway pseudopilin PulG
MKNIVSIHRPQQGFTYAEVLLSVLLISILLVPALQALNTGIAGSSNDLAARQFELRSKVEEVLANPFGQLYSETYLYGGNTPTSVSASYSDAAGTTDRRVVVFYRYDVATNALSSNDTGLLYVNTYYEAEGSANGLSTLVGRWW